MNNKNNKEFEVTVKLNGGLGNRLFKIACCIGYAEKYGHNVVLYSNMFDNNTHSSNVKTIDILKYMIPEITISKSIKNENTFYKLEHHGNEACKYLELPYINSDVLLHGYFQSEMYFPKGDNYFLCSFINNVIIPRKTILTNPLISLVSENGTCNKYFIHVRMGDYIANELHYIGYKKYLKNSINYIKFINAKAEFIIFSNELDKNKILKEFDSNLLNENTFQFECDINPELDELESLINMGICKGGICVNSTFSWFGAYIANKSNILLHGESTIDYLDEIIIMPSKWFNTDHIKVENYKDIYPKWNNLVLLDI
jgi:hypothetical protein